MNQVPTSDTQTIVVEETFPHPPAVVWHALTSSALIGRWLMPPAGFEPVVGNRFSFRTKPAGEWDGTISCKVLEIVENELMSFEWVGGHEANEGYGSKLETVVTFALSPVAAGTRLRLTHSGFARPRNDVAYRNMSDGWQVVVKRLDAVVAEEAAPQTKLQVG